MTNSISLMLSLNESMTNLSPCDYSWINARWMRSVYNIYTVWSKLQLQLLSQCLWQQLLHKLHLLVYHLMTHEWHLLVTMNGICWSSLMTSTGHHDWHLLVTMNGMYWSSFMVAQMGEVIIQYRVWMVMHNQDCSLDTRPYMFCCM